MDFKAGDRVQFVQNGVLTKATFVEYDGPNPVAVLVLDDRARSKTYVPAALVAPLRPSEDYAKAKAAGVPSFFGSLPPGAVVTVELPG